MTLTHKALICCLWTRGDGKMTEHEKFLQMVYFLDQLRHWRPDTPLIRAQLTAAQLLIDFTSEEDRDEAYRELRC